MLTKRVIAALAAAATAVSMATVAMLAVGADPAGAVSTRQTSLVGTVPMAGTPNIGDGSVQAFTQVGSKVFVGGNFTSATPPGRPPR